MTPRIQVLRYEPVPLLPTETCNVAGVVFCALDGNAIEPLLVLNEDDGSFSLQSIETVSVGGVTIDLRGTSRGVTLDSDRFNAALRSLLVRAVATHLGRSPEATR